MPNTITDIYRGHSPRAFVFIGGKSVLVEDYNLTSTIRGEAGVATVKIPLENIDSSVFTDPSVLNNIFEIQIWSGYLEDKRDPDEQLKELFSEISKITLKKESTKQRYFTKRFDGYVLQPEWEFGDANYITLSCIDWTGILRDFKIAKSFQNNDTEAKGIIAYLNSQLSGIEIVMDKYNGSIKLGDIDSEDNKAVYNAVGKTYYDVIEEVAAKVGLIIIPDGKRILLTKAKDNPLLWPMYYGPKEFQESGGVPLGQYFSNLSIRYGAKGRTDKSNVLIEVLGMNYRKKKDGTLSDKGQKVRVVFPEDAAVKENTKYETIKLSGDITESQAKVYAETRYRQLASRLITGTITLPFANHFMQLQDIVEFVPDDSKKDLAFLKGKWFSVNSISESYGVTGYTQTVEFDSDPTLQNAPRERIAPVNEKIGVTDIGVFLRSNDNILNRKL